MSGLVIESLRKYFFRGGGLLGGPKLAIRAVEDVSLTVPSGASVGLVGESGCGKSTVSRAILRLIEPDAGRIVFDGIDVRAARPAALRRLRRRMQIIFQDPYSSLNGRRTIRQTLEEPLKVHGVKSRAERRERADAILTEVGLPPESMDRFPHEFSGGQRQRIGIARSLAMNPDLVICDEPVSALDVSVQAQVLNLLRQLQSDFNLTYLFIAHNLAVVAHISDRVGVMYLGKLVEIGESKTITEQPKHPYTQALISAIPIADPHRQRDRIILEGDVPSPANPPTGCRFHPRCPVARPDCSEREPLLREITPGHWVACHYAE